MLNQLIWLLHKSKVRTSQGRQNHMIPCGLRIFCDEKLQPCWIALVFLVPQETRLVLVDDLVLDALGEQVLNVGVLLEITLDERAGSLHLVRAVFFNILQRALQQLGRNTLASEGVRHDRVLEINYAILDDVIKMASEFAVQVEFVTRFLRILGDVHHLFPFTFFKVASLARFPKGWDRTI